jgi:hypothetical protein
MFKMSRSNLLIQSATKWYVAIPHTDGPLILGAGTQIQESGRSDPGDLCTLGYCSDT